MDYSTAPASVDFLYRAAPDRHAARNWRTAGRSGLKLPSVTIGTWQNFSDLDPRESVRTLYLGAFDRGVYSFDFGNNYGRPPGSAERMFGTFLAAELKPYRRELVIATKAGYDMWPGPHGEGSSLKYLISSLDESLERLGLEYVDVFYSHRFDPQTPLEETADALDLARRSGRCLYVGISSYPPESAAALALALAERGTQLLINQSHYNLLTQWPERELLELCARTGVGFAAFSPLAQGLLSAKTLDGAMGRATEQGSSVWCSDWDRLRAALAGLAVVASERNETVSQLALSWVLRRPEVTTAVIGLRNLAQLDENLRVQPNFTAEHEAEIARLCAGVDVDLWAGSSHERPRSSPVFV